MSETVVGKASPTVTATGPANGTAGTAIATSSISSALGSGSSPTGTITFKVFGPQSSAPTSCSTGGTTVGTATVSGNATYHPSAGYTPTAAGNYWWYASLRRRLEQQLGRRACAARGCPRPWSPRRRPTVTATGPSTDTVGTPISSSSISSVLGLGLEPDGHDHLQGLRTAVLCPDELLHRRHDRRDGDRLGQRHLPPVCGLHADRGRQLLVVRLLRRRLEQQLGREHLWLGDVRDGRERLDGHQARHHHPAGLGSGVQRRNLGPIAVQVENASNSPVNVSSNTTVNLSSNSTGGSSPRLTPAAPTTTVTINAGSSSTSFFYGDTKAGSPTITANSGSLTPATQVETITAGAANSITIVSGSPQSAQVDTAFAPSRRLGHRHLRQPGRGASVSFTAPSSGASGTFSNSTNTITSPTGSNGQAISRPFTANTIAGGPYQVSASTPGPSAVNFQLTNTPGRPRSWSSHPSPAPTRT